MALESLRSRSLRSLSLILGIERSHIDATVCARRAVGEVEKVVAVGKKIGPAMGGLLGLEGGQRDARATGGIEARQARGGIRREHNGAGSAPGSSASGDCIAEGLRRTAAGIDLVQLGGSE